MENNQFQLFWLWRTFGGFGDTQNTIKWDDEQNNEEKKIKGHWWNLCIYLLVEYQSVSPLVLWLSQGSPSTLWTFFRKAREESSILTSYTILCIPTYHVCYISYLRTRYLLIDLLCLPPRINLPLLINIFSCQRHLWAFLFLYFLFSIIKKFFF